VTSGFAQSGSYNTHEAKQCTGQSHRGATGNHIQSPETDQEEAYASSREAYSTMWKVAEMIPAES